MHTLLLHTRESSTKLVTLLSFRVCEASARAPPIPPKCGGNPRSVKLLHNSQLFVILLWVLLHVLRCYTFINWYMSKRTCSKRPLFQMGYTFLNDDIRCSHTAVRMSVIIFESSIRHICSHFNFSFFHLFHVFRVGWWFIIYRPNTIHHFFELFSVT